MFVRRAASLVTAIVAAATLSACTQLSQLQAPNPIVSTPRTYNYTAIGASDAVGYGSSKPCATAPVVIGPDTELMPSPASCPSGTGYVPDVSRLIATGVNTVALTDLGISGAVIGPDIRAVGNTYEPLIDPTCGHAGQAPCVPGDFLSDELPVLPSQATTVTIFAGGNDTDAIFAGAAVIAGGGGDPTSFIGSEIRAFGIDYGTLIGAVHKAFPFARIYIANLPNFGLIPGGVALGGSAQALLDVISTSIDGGVISVLAVKGIPTIDLECNPQSYNPANFYVDGFHLNDSGYLLFANLLSTAITNFGAPPPADNCPPYSLSVARKPFTGLHGLRVKLPRY